jgi:hypothetical protein
MNTHTDSVSRRQVLRGGLLTGAGVLWVPGIASGQTSDSVQQEQQSGDPGAPPELALADEKKILEIFSIVAFGVQKSAQDVCLRMLNVAGDYLGQSKYSNPAMVRDFFQVFGMNAGDQPDNFLAFCAAGLGYCAAKAYCEVSPSPFNPSQANIKNAISDINRQYFRPDPLVRVMQTDAVKRKTWISQSDIRENTIMPGWPIIFSWNHDGVANHVGLVKQQDGLHFTTIEFNTRVSTGGDQSQGGHVAIKDRDIVDVLGIIKAY